MAHGHPQNSFDPDTEIQRGVNMKKMINHKTICTLFYLAAILNYIAAAMSALSDRPAGTSLALGSLSLALGLIYSKKAGDNKKDKDNK